MKQEPITRIESECGKCELLFENTMTLFELHDFLLVIKGNIVDRISEAQKQDVESNERYKAAKIAAEAAKAEEENKENLPTTEEAEEASKGE